MLEETMDPTSWSAYSQHFSRLGATMNPSTGPLTQSAQLNDLALSSTIPRQDHISGYGNAAGTHHFLLTTSHGLNPSQASNRADPSFNTSSLFAANYDASLLSASFQPSGKGHISTFPQSSGLFKAVNRENDFTDLRTGFSHCSVAAYARNPDGNNGLSGGSGLGSSALFSNSMASGSWRHSGIMPPTCGPFGVLPHETVLQRSHLVGRGSEKLGVQVSKPSRSSLSASSFVDQDLSRGYRSILSSPARPPSSFMDPSNASHSTLLSPQNDPYFSSVSDSYYSSCSKTDFGAYSSYCSNVQPTVQRSAISPYCYSQSFGAFDATIEKQDLSSTPSTTVSANANFTNFVPNSGLNGNPTHIQNGPVSRQTVITSNTSSNNPPSVIYNPQSHQAHQNQSYGQRDMYPYTSVSSHSVSSLPAHSGNSSNSSSSNGVRQNLAHMNNSQHSSLAQALYPPMSTPVPASTPAHPTPPASMGQAYVPASLVMNHDSACSSVASQPIMYNSPSNDACYSTPGTCPSESASPAKQEMSQHSSPSVYSIDNSNLSMNSGPFVDPSRIQSQNSAEANYVVNMVNNTMATELHDSTNDSASKLLDDNLPVVDSDLISSDCSSQQKELHMSTMLPLDMAKASKANSFENIEISSVFENHSMDINLPSITNVNHRNNKQNESLQPPSSQCSENDKCDVFAFSSDSPPPVIDYTRKTKLKSKRGRKRKSICHVENNVLPLNCGYPPSPLVIPEIEKGKMISRSCDSAVNINSPLQKKLTVTDASSLPVDLSHVSLNLTVKKTEESLPTTEIENDNSELPELSYGPSVIPSSNWPVSDCEVADIESKVQNLPVDENKKLGGNETVKCNQQLCETSAIDDMSDESKTKLCTSIEDDLGFLAELSSASDAEDGTSKESISIKKANKEQGFLQSFLTFLEGSEDPPVSSLPSETKSQKQTKIGKCRSTQMPVLSNKGDDKGWLISKERAESVVENDNEGDGNKKNNIQDHEDKDNFDEAPSLDPTLFGCTTLQKEMVVPNPEAPSFSSDEDENSAQGIFDTVAMAIQRLCEDNDDEVNDKIEKSLDMQEEDNKIEMPVLRSINQEDENSNKFSDKLKTSLDENQKLNVSLTTKRKRGRRKRIRHSYAIKVNNSEKFNAQPDFKEHKLSTEYISEECTDEKVVEKIGDSSARKSLMRKCKEQGLLKKEENKKKRKQRHSVQRKYIFEDQDDKEYEMHDVEDNTLMEKDEKNLGPPVRISLHPKISCDELPKKMKKTSRKRQKRKKHHGHHSHHRKSCGSPFKETESLCVEPNNQTAEEETRLFLSGDISDLKRKHKCTNNGENNWNTEIHFKTGDYVISVDNRNNSQPPIWRIEGKTVLQLFEAFEEDGKILYRNTSSYSRWSPSSKYKYARMAVRVVTNDDDTVIVETLKRADKAENIEISGTLPHEDSVTHPQRENFEVYLQTLVSHALDPDFIPEIIKENDEYFLSHLQAIEEFTSQKKKKLVVEDICNSQLQKSAEIYPHLSVSRSKEEGKNSCQVCNSSKTQYTVHFHGQLYDSTTLEHKANFKGHLVCDSQFSLCGSCVQTVTLYSRLHHHKYHFFQLGCAKVKNVRRGEDKESHAILEECLQDTEWMSQMFQEMVEMWNACDKFR